MALKKSLKGSLGRKRTKRARHYLKRPVPPAVKKFLSPGKQTAITPEVRRFASRFSGTGLKDVKEIVRAVAGMTPKTFKFSEVGKVYFKRTASQIIKDGFVAVSFGQSNSKTFYVGGCIDTSLVLCAVLRAKGIPTRFVRKRHHAEAHFFKNGNWYTAHTLSPTFPEIRLVNKAEEKELSKGVKEGGVGIGLDAWDIGINGIEDFHNFGEHR